MTMDAKSLVSVIIPLYNCEKYLPEALDSLVAQTVPDWEAILVDDCSADGSAAMADAYAARDPRFRVFDSPRTAALPRPATEPSRTRAAASSPTSTPTITGCRRSSSASSASCATAA